MHVSLISLAQSGLHVPRRSPVFVFKWVDGLPFPTSSTSGYLLCCCWPPARLPDGRLGQGKDPPKVGHFVRVVNITRTLISGSVFSGESELRGDNNQWKWDRVAAKGVGKLPNLIINVYVFPFTPNIHLTLWEGSINGHDDYQQAKWVNCRWLIYRYTEPIFYFILFQSSHAYMCFLGGRLAIPKSRALRGDNWRG